jgi:hypothetical protein
MTLSVCRIPLNGRITDELQKIWKEAIVTNRRTMLEFPEGTEGNLENRDSNRALIECESRALPLCHPACLYFM